MTDRKGRIQAYAHRSCSYVRTSSTKYSLKPQDLAKKGVHLVNDGVQNKEESYGKFEAGNKLSLLDFAKRVEAPTDWLETTLVPVWKSHFRRPCDVCSTASRAPRHRRDPRAGSTRTRRRSGPCPSTTRARSGPSSTTS